MKVNQLSVFLEDKDGHLAECINLLSKNNIDIQAMSLADAEGFKILHFITGDSDKIVWSLKRNGFGVAESEVMLLHLPDSLKSLESILQTLKKNNFTIEYMYTGRDCQFVLRVDDLEAALKTVDVSMETCQ
jgi:hypothetical protein